MKNLKTTLFLAAALLGTFSLLSFRPALNVSENKYKTYCDSTEKSELAIFMCDSTEKDSLISSIGLLQALSDSTETDSLTAAYTIALSGCDTTDTKKDDEESLYNMLVLESFASDTTKTDTISAV